MFLIHSRGFRVDRVSVFFKNKWIHDAIAGRYCIATRGVQTDNVRPVRSKFIHPLFEPLNPLVENCADRDLALTSIYRDWRQRSQPGSEVSKHCGSKVRRRLQKLFTNPPSCQYYVVFLPPKCPTTNYHHSGTNAEVTNCLDVFSTEITCILTHLLRTRWWH